MSLSKKTINSIFMTPTIGVDLSILKQHNHINSYGTDGLRFEQYEDVVYLLFQPLDWGKFTAFVESEYERTSDIIDDYDYENGHVVLVYKLNPVYKKDFDLIRKGMYSETSEKFQKLFKEEVIVIINGVPSKERSFQNLIFFRSKKLRNYWEEKFDTTIPTDKEAWPMYDTNKETLKL